jgi:hypothetical protein
MVGRLQMKIGARFSNKDAAKAHELVESIQSTGKVILNVKELIKTGDFFPVFSYGD